MIVEVQVRFKEETEKARQVIVGGIRHIWIPKSLITYRRKQADGTGVVQVPKWFAEQERLDYEEL